MAFHKLYEVPPGILQRVSGFNALQRESLSFTSNSPARLNKSAVGAFLPTSWNACLLKYVWPIFVVASQVF